LTDKKEGMLMVHYIPMTVSGEKKLREELKYLKHVQRPKIIFAISEARKHGDLKENAEYHSAREEQGFCEGRIQKIEKILSNAQIIDIKKINNEKKVIFGVTVTLLNTENNKNITYKIVGDDEANIKYNLISINSPLARGLISKNLHQIVHIVTPNGKKSFKILKIEHV